MAGDLELELNGGSELTCTGVEAGALLISLKGGSDVDCDGIAADTLDATLDGGSRLRLAGDIATAEIDGSGASEFDLRSLALAGADVRLSGGSEADLDVSGVLEAELRGGSEVRYTGDPVIGKTELRDGSTVEPAS